MKIIIFGATSAIAVETARLLANRGDELILVARNKDKLYSVVQDLRARASGKVDSIIADLNDLDKHASLLEKAKEILGDYDLVLIAHGTLSNQEVCEKDFKKAEDELKTNFLSAVSLLTPIANEFEKRKSGHIVVISSVAGDRGRQSNYIYGTAKGALSIFLQGLRNRLAKSDVTVTTIKPGFVDTPMTANFDKGPLFVGPDVIARGILRAIQNKSDIVYLPWFWWPIMMVIKAIPEGVFKRLKL
ncbi:MAG: SDR family oxidoreductase [Bdellovibrionales bacterium]|nr:SDR family oxidoreductase [Bdellovibrionales bacterium]